MTTTITSPIRVEFNYTATDKFPPSVAEKRHAAAYIRSMRRGARRATTNYGTVDQPLARVSFRVAKRDVLQFVLDSDANEIPAALSTSGNSGILTIVSPNIIDFPAHVIALPEFVYDYALIAWRGADENPIELHYGKLLVLEDVG